jgi:PAS domain S-box-containing protein
MIYLAYARSVVAIDHEYAFELYRKAYEIIKKEQSEYWYIKVVTEYLRYFLRYGDRNSFENLYSEFMNRIENENICTYSLLSIIKTFQAHHYGQINNFDSAIFYNRQALELRKKDENSRLIGFSYLNLFSNYINNNKLDSAKLWLDSARNELFVKGNLKSKRHFIEYKIKMFQTQNLKDSVLNNYKLLLQIEKDYHLEQQRTQAQILKAKNEINNKLQAEKYHLQITKKQNRLIYVSIITVLSLIIIVYLLFKIKSKNIRFKNLYLVSKLDKSALQKYSKEVEQLKNIFKNANKGFFILDKQLKIDYYNTAAIDLFDNFHEGQNKISFLKYVPRNQQSIFENVIAKVTSINENQEIQLNIPDKKGEIRTFNISISPMHVNNDIESFLLIISDVTRASIAFESEKKQRRILQSLINSVSESIILIGANRKIQLLNSTAAARLGSVVEDLIDADYLESIPFHTREVREKKLSEVIETGKMVVFNEEKESYNYLISYYPSTNPEGMVEFVAEFSQDITERRLATEHINSLRQKVLRSQMNPHFIFNSLNAIQSYVLKNDAPQAVKYLNSFARLIRMILDSSRYDYITLAKEIKILEYYLELQQLRFGDKFIYQLEIDKNLDIEGLLIPAMLAQPFIENSIEHGLQHLEDKGKVKISFVKVKNSVVFKVVDNGIGREASYKIQEKIQHKDTSLSTQLFKERLYTLNKFSGKKITYNIVDLKDDAGVAKGTMVIINLPLIYKSDLNHN